MTRKELVLASMATCCGHTYTPVQLQKLLFLVDKRTPKETGGPHFNFQPYHYGPFDKDVYSELNALQNEGLVEIIKDSELEVTKYRLLPNGAKLGEEALGRLDKATREFVQKLSDFVRAASFPQLISAIYEAYPEMRVNSVFKG